MIGRIRVETVVGRCSVGVGICVCGTTNISITIGTCTSSLVSIGLFQQRRIGRSLSMDPFGKGWILCISMGDQTMTMLCLKFL